eukprot:3443179-Ditylum_brightwellii.AAC.1
MEGEVNQGGIANKNHIETRVDTQLLDINNSCSNDASQNTAVMGLTMVGNTNNNTMSILSVVEGASNLNLDAKTIEGDDDDT